MTDTQRSRSRRVPLSELDTETEGVPYTLSEVCHELHDIVVRMDEPKVLEIACGYGKATPYLASAAAVTGGHVRAVDNQRHEWEGDTVRDRLRELDLLEQCSVSLGQDARWYIFDLLRDDSGKWIDFVYFDLSHTLEIDAFVALAAWNHLRPGGVMVFDDLDWIPAEHGPSDLETERPDMKQIGVLFEYLTEFPEVGQHGTWGRDTFGWMWGILRKEPRSTEENEDLRKKIDELTA
jgi:predicted O-methyltransferase YrrM